MYDQSSSNIQVTEQKKMSYGQKEKSPFDAKVHKHQRNFSQKAENIHLSNIWISALKDNNFNHEIRTNN